MMTPPLPAFASVALYSVIAAFAPSVAGAQTILLSADGTSSVVLQDGGVVLVNFADKSGKLGLTRITSPGPWRYGAEAKLKVADGFSQLGGADAHPEGSASVFLGRLLKDPRRSAAVPAQWATVEVSSVRARYSLVAPTANEPLRRVDSAFTGPVVTGYYNVSVAPGHLPLLSGDALLGVALGFGRRNNYEDDALTKTSVCTVSASSGSTSLQKCKDAKQGSYVESNNWSGAFDLGFYQGWLENRILVDFMGRYSGVSSTGAFSPGIGIFATKDGSPLAVIGGLTLEWKGGKRPVLGFQVGIPTS